MKFMAKDNAPISISAENDESEHVADNVLFAFIKRQEDTQQSIGKCTWTMCDPMFGYRRGFELGGSE